MNQISLPPLRKTTSVIAIKKSTNGTKRERITRTFILFSLPNVSTRRGSSYFTAMDVGLIGTCSHTMASPTP